MLYRLLQARFLVIIIVIFTIINAVVFVGLGIYSSIDGIIGIFNGEVHTDAHPGIKILESLDIFLVALVFLIFAMGIARLFLTDSVSQTKMPVPEWLNLQNFTDLKLLLWEAVLTTLVVYFISDVVKRDGHYTWELLVLPGSIALLAISIYIIRKE